MVNVSNAAKAGVALLGAGTIAENAQSKVNVDTTTATALVAKAGIFTPPRGTDPRLPPGAHLDGLTGLSPVAFMQPPVKEKTVGELKAEREAKKVELGKTIEEENKKLATASGAGKKVDDRTQTEDGINKYLTAKTANDTAIDAAALAHWRQKNCRTAGLMEPYMKKGADNKQQTAEYEKWVKIKDIPEKTTGPALKVAEDALAGLPNQDLVATMRRAETKLAAAKAELNGILEAEKKK